MNSEWNKGVPPLYPQQKACESIMVDHCQCKACRTGIIHASDCAVHNMPAEPNGPCNCEPRAVIAEVQATIERLQAKNAELTQAKRNLSSLLDRALEQNETLKAENAELRRDAELYRLIRDSKDGNARQQKDKESKP